MFTYLAWKQSSWAVWRSRWMSWAPVPNKLMVSVDVKQHSTTTAWKCRQNEDNWKLLSPPSSNFHNSWIFITGQHRGYLLCFLLLFLFVCLFMPYSLCLWVTINIFRELLGRLSEDIIIILIYIVCVCFRFQERWLKCGSLIWGARTLSQAATPTCVYRSLWSG